MRNFCKVAFCMALLMVIMGCAGFEKANEESSNEFYKMRQEHATKLVKEGPSPMENQDLVMPDNASEITYKSGDLILKAWISNELEANKKYPAVVYLHGGFGFSEKNWDEAQAYIDSGFVLMTPMLRGENGNPGYYELLYGEADDVIAAAEYLSEQPFVDSEHIFLAGHSLGGGNALVTSMLPSKYKAVATFGASPLDLKAELESNKGLMEVIPFDTSNQNEFDLRIPVKYPQYVTKPLHMFVETESHLIGIQDLTKSFSEKVKENGIESEYYLIEGNHLTAIDESIRESVEIFKSKVAGGVSSASEPGNQSYKDISEVIDSLQDPKDKEAVLLADKFRMALPYWDSDVLTEISTESTYKKIEKFKKKISATETQTLVSEETKGIKVEPKKNNTVLIEFDDFYLVDDTERDNQIQVRLIHKITVDKDEQIVSNYSYIELL